MPGIVGGLSVTSWALDTTGRVELEIFEETGAVGNSRAYAVSICANPPFDFRSVNRCVEDEWGPKKSLVRCTKKPMVASQPTMANYKPRLWREQSIQTNKTICYTSLHGDGKGYLFYEA